MWLYGNITLPYVKIFLFLLLQQLFCVHMWLYGHMLIPYAQKRLNRIIFHGNTIDAVRNFYPKEGMPQARAREASHILQNKKQLLFRKQKSNYIIDIWHSQINLSIGKSVCHSGR